jgi:hypothetical protein
MGERYYSNNPADRAKDILNHYFKLLFDKVGLNYDADIQTELDQIVDAIIEASKDETHYDCISRRYDKCVRGLKCSLNCELFSKEF